MIAGPVIALADRLLVNMVVTEGPTKLPLVLIEEASAAVRHYSLGKILHLYQKLKNQILYHQFYLLLCCLLFVLLLKMRYLCSLPQCPSQKELFPQPLSMELLQVGLFKYYLFICHSCFASSCYLFIRVVAIVYLN